MFSRSNNLTNSLDATLGVVAISYNEEQDLPGFLGHLLPWVDEIVIVDDGSVDQTEKIAASVGEKVKFIIAPRKDGEFYSHQRNKGIMAAESDWLLHMDIDERVSPSLAEEIRLAIEDPGKDAYRYRRLNYFMHRPMRGGGWQDWNLVHLARREVFRFGGMFHEDCIVDAPPERIGQLKSFMWHLNDDSYLERMRKSNSYCEEQAMNLQSRGLRIRWWHFLVLPAVEFLKKYFKRKGYRDGTLGLLFALHATSARFKACALVWDEQNRTSRSEVEEQVSSTYTKKEGD